jgi:hypothetical protein
LTGDAFYQLQINQYLPNRFFLELCKLLNTQVLTDYFGTADSTGILDRSNGLLIKDDIIKNDFDLFGGLFFHKSTSIRTDYKV